jgi:transcription antitermination factor NusG
MGDGEALLRYGLQECFRCSLLPAVASVRRGFCGCRENLLSWFAVYTASNHEKRVVQHLQARKIETFLPLYSVTKRWKNRTTVKIEMPVFAGYVFARIDPSERIRVIEVPMVYSLVGTRGVPTPLPDADIARLRTALQSPVVSNISGATPDPPILFVG